MEGATRHSPAVMCRMSGDQVQRGRALLSEALQTTGRQGRDWPIPARQSRARAMHSQTQQSNYQTKAQRHRAMPYPLTRSGCCGQRLPRAYRKR